VVPTHGFGRPSHLEPPAEPAEAAEAAEDASELRGDEEEFELRLGEETPLPSHDPEALSEARHFRDVLGRFCTGVTVVTSIWEGTPVGMTCQSFTSVSLSPPLVLFCASKASAAWPRMQRAGFFCVNLLADGQHETAARMATRGADRFAGVRWSPSTTGAPLLDGILGYVDCTVEAVHEAGDHHVVIGSVQDLGFGDAEEPLLFFRSKYTTTR
jgi:3-hydroxy-9,10-secoandrosta-1,3,5(10)-triene-9,17-dione monooxygenase reductase component